MLYLRIKKLRLLKAITQKEMAERLHKSASAYHRMESGEIKIDLGVLSEIAGILNCSTEELLQDEMTVCIKDEAAPATHADNHANVPEELLLAFKNVYQEMVAYQEKSEKRIISFMKEIILEIRKQK